MHQCTFAMASAVMLTACATSSLAQDASTLHMASALEGCWEHREGATQEQWTDTGLGLMFGYTVTTRNGELRAFEDLRIEPSSNGMVFVASPNGARPIRFTAVAQSPSSVTFENPDHDFPQRITYARTDDRLVATIARLDGGNAIDIVMHACTDGEH